MDISASLAFIEEHGSPLEKARCRHMLYGVQPEPEVTQPFIALQNDDGGFPTWPETSTPNADSSRATCAPMHWASNSTPS